MGRERSQQPRQLAIVRRHFFTTLLVTQLNNSNCAWLCIELHLPIRLMPTTAKIPVRRPLRWPRWIFKPARRAVYLLPTRQVRLTLRLDAVLTVLITLVIIR